MSVKIVQLDMLEIHENPVKAASDVIDKIIALDMERIQKQIEIEEREKQYDLENALRAIFSRDGARQKDVKLLKDLYCELYRVVRNLDDRIDRVLSSI